MCCYKTGTKILVSEAVYIGIFCEVLLAFYSCVFFFGPERLHAQTVLLFMETNSSNKQKKIKLPNLALSKSSPNDVEKGSCSTCAKTNMKSGHVPGTPITASFEGQSPKTRPFSTKTRIISVLGIYTYNPGLPHPCSEKKLIRLDLSCGLVEPNRSKAGQVFA